MFGGSSNSAIAKSESDSKPDKSPSPEPAPAQDASAPKTIKTAEASTERRGGSGGSPPTRKDVGGSTEKKRRSSSVSSKASSLLASAKNSLSLSQGGRAGPDLSGQTPIQKLGRQDPALAVPQGQHNNSAGESMPGPKSTFRVGVWEDRNKKCRRTMEDTHAFLYNFLHTPAHAADASSREKLDKDESDSAIQDMNETDNGYFAIFDGHAGSFAADWCGKKLHIILEDIIRKHPNAQIPEILDQTFTTVDSLLEKLPLKNSGCTAAVAVLRWEERVPSDRSATGSQALAPATAALARNNKSDDGEKERSKETLTEGANSSDVHARLKGSASRQRVLYTANVGDARIILCRAGKALRLSYDHKGSDENEGKRIASAGGLILNNRVNGVLAVTRALGDAYMKKLVTGHPYTTETVIQPESDEFIIIACDGLWDVCSDQEAVDLVREVYDPVSASRQLVDHALNRFSTDNLSCMIVRFDKEALARSQQRHEIGIETSGASQVTEADKIISNVKQRIADGTVPSTGVSASNSGRGHDPMAVMDAEFKPTSLGHSVVEEEPVAVDDTDSPEVTPGTEMPLELPAHARVSEEKKTNEI